MFNDFEIQYLKSILKAHKESLQSQKVLCDLTIDDLKAMSNGDMKDDRRQLLIQLAKIQKATIENNLTLNDSLINKVNYGNGETKTHNESG